VLTDAIRFAVGAHEGQKRKGSGLPYIVHPLEVMQILLRHGVDDEETLVAAVLHDAVEDTDVTIEAIRERYGERVAAIVAALTKPREGSKAEQKRVAGELLKAGPPAARVVKMADRLSNLRDLDRLAWTAERKTEYRREALEFARVGETAHAALAAALRAEAGAS
jgi:GTP diphosphokinase / guanosine-3',5'-bis(diphosphate) 3'-diphosphatase